jgi:hypothetical protein
MVVASEVKPLKVRRTVQSVKNERTQAQIEGGKPRFVVI